jgi:hypothetical protein
MGRRSCRSEEQCGDDVLYSISDYGVTLLQYSNRSAPGDAFLWPGSKLTPGMRGFFRYP